MDKINVNNWQYFRVKDIFNIIKDNNISVSDFSEDRLGDVKLLSSKSINNGVVFNVNSKYIDNYKIHNFSDYFLSISTNGECGVVFLQKGKVIKTSDVTLLLPKNKLEKNKLLFLKTILEKEKYRYSWGRKNKGNHINNTLIKLPTIKVNGKIIPDWNFMENYIREIGAKIIKLDELSLSKKSSLEEQNLKINLWNDFKIKDLISLIKVFPINKNEIEDSFVDKKEIPYFTRTSENNGIQDFYNIEPTQPKETLSVGSVANKMFFQPYAFALGPYTLNFKLKSKHNLFTSLFFITICNFNFKTKYSFSRGLTQKTLLKEIVKLPSIKVNGKIIPDWNFMENYIKSLPFSKNL